MRGCLIVVAVGCNFHAGGVEDAPPAVEPNLVFVTSGTVVPGNLGGLDAADAVCQMHAQSAGLSGTYVAWLSSTTNNARDRLGSASGWARPDGLPFVDTIDDLAAGRVLYPPRLDEHGDEAIDVAIATATDGNGMRADETCDDYTSTNPAITVGRGDGGTERWTNINAGVGCATPVHLYCFGIDRAAHVAVTPAAGKRAFLSTAAITFAGIDSVDAQCASDAANLQGTFLAALATTAASATSRFTGGSWVRVDGVAIGTLDAPLAPLDVTADGRYVATQVWTGASKPDAIGADGSTCADWLSPADTGTVGDAARSNQSSFDDGGGTCSQFMLGVYCLEQ